MVAEGRAQRAKSLTPIFAFLVPLGRWEERRQDRRIMPPDTLLRLYRRMVRIRVFEEKVQELHALGKLPGFVHVYLGEEAVAVGACSCYGTPTTSPAPTGGMATALPWAPMSLR